jgi:hypothetical protein
VPAIDCRSNPIQLKKLFPRGIRPELGDIGSKVFQVEPLKSLDDGFRRSGGKWAKYDAPRFHRTEFTSIIILLVARCECST